LGAGICAGERNARRGQDDVMGRDTIDQSDDRSALHVPVGSIASLWLCAVTSGLPPTPDILGARRHVSKVPISDIA
jgi:hypothetical protein